MLEIDHVVICIDDLDTGSALFETRYGLTALPGGKHAGHGTANNIVPLGSSYLELVAVVDGREASESAFGRWVLTRAAEGSRPDAVCLRTDDLSLLSTNLGLDVTVMSRTRPDGVRLAWRLGGLTRTIDDGLPFFIEWGISGEHHPGRAPIEQAKDSTSIEVSLTGDVEKLTAWAGAASGVSLAEGDPGIERVTVRTEGQTIEL